MKHHETLKHSPFDAAILALDAKTSALGVSGNIGDCRVGITQQMCNRVTNNGDMGTFSKPECWEMKVKDML